MSDNIISPSDAGLVLHRFVTEQIPVLAWFVSSGRLVTVKVSGFVPQFSKAVGLVISTEWPTESAKLSGVLTLSHDFVAAATFRYSDETEVPDDFELGSGLRIDLPNGDTLTIAERRDKKS